MYMLQLMSLKAIAVAGVGGVVRSLPSPFQLIHFDINLPPPPRCELKKQCIRLLNQTFIVSLGDQEISK